MVPYNSPNTRGQKKFNKALTKARVRVEHAFGQLKRRFAICHSGLRLALERMPTVVLCCFILHNMAVEMNLPEIEEEYEGEEDERDLGDTEPERIPNPPISERRRKQEGSIKRDEMATRFEQQQQQQNDDDDFIE